MNKTTKIILLVIFIVIIILAGIWYGEIKKSKEKGKETIKIGAILPLTGNAAKKGEYEAQGALMAVEEINSQGGIKGKKIELLIEDSGTDPKKGISAFRKLVEIDKVSCLIGGLSSVGMPLKDLIEENKIPTIWVSAHPDFLTGTKYIFRNLPTSAQFVEALSNFIYQEFKLSKIGILYMNDDYGVSLKDEFEKIFPGTILFKEQYDKDGKDFRTQIIKAKEKNPEVIFIAGYGTATGILIKQLREMEVDAQLCGPIGIAQVDTKKSAGLAIKGVIYPEFIDNSKEEVKKFKEKYMAKYGQEPGVDSFLGYNSIKLLAYAIEKSGLDPDLIVDTLSNLRNFKSASGMLNIKNKEVRYEITIKKIE